MVLKTIALPIELHLQLEVMMGIEPMIMVLQTTVLPLHYITIKYKNQPLSSITQPFSTISSIEVNAGIA